MTQPEFDFSKPVARKTDPITSHLAAGSFDPAGVEVAILDVIRRHGAAGCISNDVLAALPQYGYGTITPRYRVLLKKKLIRSEGTRVAASGRSQRVMIAEGLSTCETCKWFWPHPEELLNGYCKLHSAPTLETDTCEAHED